jgi:hypothetical protein
MAAHIDEDVIAVAPPPKKIVLVDLERWPEYEGEAANLPSGVAVFGFIASEYKKWSSTQWKLCDFKKTLETGLWLCVCDDDEFYGQYERYVMFIMGILALKIMNMPLEEISLVITPNWVDFVSNALALVLDSPILLTFDARCVESSLVYPTAS